MAASLCVGSLYLISTSRCDLSVALRRWSMGGCCTACGPFTFQACRVVSRSIGCVELRAVFRFRSCIFRRVSFMEKMLRPPIVLGSDMGSFSVLVGLWIARYLAATPFCLVFKLASQEHNPRIVLKVIV